MKNLRIFYLLFCLVLFSDLSAQNLKGLWVWNTSGILGNETQINILVNQCMEDEISDVYLYSYGFLSDGNIPLMQELIQRMNCNNIRVWAMDGFRAYFHDWLGPAQYYSFIDAVIAYNNSSTGMQKFTGIQGDNEPQDGQGEPLSSFHNGLSDSQLSTTGGGVWKATQALDREYLMRSFLEITEYAYNICHDNGLLYGQAMASWLDEYYGEPIQCTYNGQYKPLVHHMMDYLDDYCIMSYNTNPSNVAARVQGELTYAATLSADVRPRVWAGLETHCNIGINISYCDTPDKDSKNAVYDDMEEIKDLLSTYPALTGINIHDWTGWKNLSPVSDNSGNTEVPDCIVSAGAGKNRDAGNYFSVYPNPFINELYIENTGLTAEAGEVILLDNYGREILPENTKESGSGKILSLEKIPTGFYVLLIKSGQDVYHYKIIKSLDY